MLPLFPAHLIVRLAAMSHDVTRDQLIRRQKYNQYAAFLQEVEKPCIDAGLPRTAKQIRVVLDACAQGQCAPVTFIALLKPIFPLLCQDLEERQFLGVAPQRIRFLQVPQPRKRQSRRQSARTKGADEALREFHAARRCFGLGEPTACVLHLTRVIDFGAKVVAKSLGIKTESRTIGVLAAEIQNTVQSLVKGGKCTSETEESYNEWVTDLRAFIRAYRNPAVHQFKQFDDNQAFTLITVVGDFMGHLEKSFVDWDNPTIPKVPTGNSNAFP